MNNGLLTRLLVISLILSGNQLMAQLVDSTAKTVKKMEPEFFVAYDFGEAMVNRFQSLSGEVGLCRPNKHLIRVVHMNVWLTEQHLESDFVATVKGPNVKGRMIGWEAFYGFPIIKWKEGHEAINLSPSIGFYSNQYEHIKLNSGFRQNSMTTGLEVSYREHNPFGVKGLYYALTIPMRMHFKPHEEVILGETTILSNRLDGNLWFFVGWQF